MWKNQGIFILLFTIAFIYNIDAIPMPKPQHFPRIDLTKDLLVNVEKDFARGIHHVIDMTGKMQDQIGSVARSIQDSASNLTVGLLPEHLMKINNNASTTDDDVDGVEVTTASPEEQSVE
ncbi:hypothetical protein PV327_000503 [Microctonus hyperodae]|uniref:Uncharacterized protein n=1 Tax=Microctonus hyperodae TaxID=165561 RepID=A0AA39G6C3_MICHY|nr:hypothetical protein PV327_000503 [Microctonus hyperodae]